MPSGFRENAEDLNTADSVQVDVNAPMTNGQLEGIGRRTAARDGSDHYTYEIDGIGYDGHWANDIARLLAEVESRGRAIEALSARLAAKNAELDKTIRESAADKVKLAEIGEGSEEWAIQVFHRPGGSGYYFHDSTGEDPEQDLADVLELLADGRDMAGNPIEHGPVSIVKRTVWSTEWKTVEPSEMPHPPAEEGPTEEQRAELIVGLLFGEPGTANESAQEPVSGPETAGTGSGRGTGVAEAPGTAEPSIAWRGEACEHKPEWRCSAHGECRGCECACFTYLPSLPVPSTEESR